MSETATVKSSAMGAVPARYDRTTIAYHWATALLIILAWGMAQIIDFFPSGALRVDARSVHIVFGVAVGVVLVARVLHRFRGGLRLPNADQGILGFGAKATHYGLYLLVAAQVALGLGYTWLRGDSIFTLFALPGTPDRDLRRFVGQTHGLIANIILIVAGLHAAAALFHHYLLRDGVLRRMMPSRSLRA